MGYVRLKKMVQGNQTLNKNQSLPCRRWLYGPMYFLNLFLRLVLLLLLYHSVKISIPHYHMFLLLHILHLFLFKLLQSLGEMSISGDSHVVLWWARDGNRRISFLKRADLPFVLNRFVAIYFWPISVHQFWNVVLLVLQQCGDGCVIIGGRSTPFEISSYAIDLVDGGQCKCKRKPCFVFDAF